MEAIYLGWFLLVLPLTAAGAILLHLHRKPDMAIFASIGAASLMLLIAALVGIGIIPPPVPWIWLQLPSLEIAFQLRFDRTFLLLVTSANLLVQLAALDELRAHPARGRFFGYLSFLAFALTGVITADYLALLFFWPLLGVAFYLLLAFPEDRPARLARAARLYFTQSFADLGLIGALLFTWARVSSGEASTNSTPSSLDWTFGLGLVFAGAGKAALVPLCRWLTTLRSGPIIVLGAVPSFSLLAALYLISGTGLIGFDLTDSVQLFPGGALLFGLSLFTLLFGAWRAARQENIYALLAALALSRSGAWMIFGGALHRDFNLSLVLGSSLGYLLLVLVVGVLLRAQPGARSLSDLSGKLRVSRLLSIAFLVAATALSELLSPFFLMGRESGFESPIYLLVQAFLLAATFLNAFALTRLVTRLLLAQPQLETEGNQRPILVVSSLLRPILVILAIGAVLGAVLFWVVGISNWLGYSSRVAFSFISSALVIALAIFLAHRWNRRPPVPRLAPAKAHWPVWRWRQFRRARAQIGREALACVSFVEAWIFNGLILAGSSYLLLGLGELLRLTQTGHLRAYLWFLALAASLFYAVLVLG